MATRIRPAFHAELLRPDDLLHLYVDGSNVHLIPDEEFGSVLTIEAPERPAFLRFTFAPQTIAESAFFEAALVPAPQNTSRTPPPPSSPRTIPSAQISIRTPQLPSRSLHPARRPRAPMSPPRSRSKESHRRADRTSEPARLCGAARCGDSIFPRGTARVVEARSQRQRNRGHRRRSNRRSDRAGTGNSRAFGERDGARAADIDS